MSTLDYPYTPGTDGRTATTGHDAHVRDLIEQLLFTQPGERVNRPEFGCGLMQLVFAPNSPELAAAMQFLVQGALTQWLGQLIELQGVDARSEDGRLEIGVRYVVRATGTQRSERFAHPGAGA